MTVPPDPVYERARRDRAIMRRSALERRGRRVAIAMLVVGTGVALVALVRWLAG